MASTDNPTVTGTEPDTTRPPQTWRDLAPWEGQPSRTDKALLGTLVVVPMFFIALTPLKPFLIAHHPILLEVVTGSNAAIGVGAAYARTGQAPLWLVVAAGVIGNIKLVWLFWWAGRRWGAKLVELLTPSPRVRTLAHDAVARHPRLLAVLLLVGEFPGVPAAVLYAVAGWARMRLATFLACCTLGATLWVGLVAGLGYRIGQPAIDLVLLVDRYAVWVSLALVVGIAVVSSIRAGKAQRTRDA